jgi:hypothetical protein
MTFVLVLLAIIIGTGLVAGCCAVAAVLIGRAVTWPFRR